MDISYHCHRGLYALNIFFFDQDVFEFMTENMNSLLLEDFALEDFFEQSIQIKRHLFIQTYQIQILIIG
jgi:hypothetical protein